jgi:DNA-directed RNA polymerase subunit L
MYVDRQEIIEELRLRKLVRKAIKVVESRRAKEEQKILAEEETLRKVIQIMLREDEVSDTESSPYDNTGLNTLNTLFDNILKTIETGYKELSSSKEQRDSFSSHMLKAIENTLAPLRALDKSDDKLEEDIDIQVSKDKPEDMADIRVDKEDQAKQDFGIEGEDLTGRDKAYDTFNKVETQIVDAYKSLHNSEDIKAFYDGLLMNLDLYFKKFEDEMQPKVDAPQTGSEVEKGFDLDSEEDLDLEDIADL